MLTQIVSGYYKLIFFYKKNTVAIFLSIFFKGNISENKAYNEVALFQSSFRAVTKILIKI